LVGKGYLKYAPVVNYGTGVDRSASRLLQITMDTCNWPMRELFVSQELSQEPALRAKQP
jgi:hypothetical protein